MLFCIYIFIDVSIFPNKILLFLVDDKYKIFIFPFLKGYNKTRHES
jgi:hypothetical protein